ncbi:MAG TPA: PAS domain S-box protein [Opitutaceae bacterium]|jgi:PAS domain S-box-containing protein
MRVSTRDPFGAVLPPDVLGASLDGFTDIVMVTEADLSDKAGPKILFVNPSFERITGYGAGEVLGKTPKFMRGPGTSESELRRIEEALRARQPVRAELLNYRRDGTAFWIEVEGNVTRSPSTGAEFFVFIERDITERKKAEALQREQERELATLFANLPGMAYRCLNDGVWTMEFVSAGCLELTGYDAEELTGSGATSFESLIEADDRKAVRDTITRAVERREAFELTYRIRDRDGGLKWVWERARPIQDVTGVVRTIEGFITDITERKLLESQVLQSQRIESIGTLAGGISHDLNNVFAPIMMAGDLLADKVPDKDSAQLLDVVAASARRGAELVRQILIFARGMEGPRVSVSTASLFADMRTFIEGAFPKSIRSSFEISPSCASVAGDPVQLHQMLLNIAVNARDAMPNGGKLAFSATPASVSPSAPRPHPDAVPGDFVRIDISDTGSGIPDILKGQIFDPFFTTKGVGRGSGLGLSTARSIVKTHRGFITFVSSEGIGTTFSVFLPTADAGLSRPVKDEPARPAGGPLPRGGGQSVLVVDDEESVRVIMRNTLESFGYKAVGAADGTEALALFRSAPGLFQMAIVDMQMPGLDGGKTIMALRHQRPDLPIVAASGLATSQNREEAAASGVRHFLDKPFSVETLIRTVHAAMAGAAK